jgi:hypothetical protein
MRVARDWTLHAGALPASSFGSFAIANDAVPCKLAGDTFSVRMQSQWACGLRGIGHYSSFFAASDVAVLVVFVAQVLVDGEAVVGTLPS